MLGDKMNWKEKIRDWLLLPIVIALSPIFMTLYYNDYGFKGVGLFWKVVWFGGVR